MTRSQIQEIDPIVDPRWRELVEAHPDGSIFHQPEWLRALLDVYGFRSTALTTTVGDGPLTDGLVLCRVESRLTGRRLVSLPFSDHCRVLTDPGEGMEVLLRAARNQLSDHFKSLEIRDGGGAIEGELPRFCLHTLDLDSADSLFENLHKSSIRRKIKRARREGLRLISGRSDDLLDDFYTLLLLTRRRHGLPPQPARWFRTLRDHLGDRFEVTAAYHRERPAAAIITLVHGRTVYYKYGASDAALNPLGGMPFVLWSAIESATEAGLSRFDFGRSATDQQGLVTFKDRFGARRLPLHYRSFPEGRSGAGSPLLLSLARTAVAFLPDRLLTKAGELLYRHAG